MNDYHPAEAMRVIIRDMTADFIAALDAHAGYSGDEPPLELITDMQAAAERALIRAQEHGDARGTAAYLIWSAFMMGVMDAAGQYDE